MLVDSVEMTETNYDETREWPSLSYVEQTACGASIMLVVIHVHHSHNGMTEKEGGSITVLYCILHCRHVVTDEIAEFAGKRT